MRRWLGSGWGVFLATLAVGCCALYMVTILAIWAIR